MERGFFVYTPSQYLELAVEGEILEYGDAPLIPTGSHYEWFSGDVSFAVTWRVVAMANELCLVTTKFDLVILYSTGIEFSPGSALLYGPPNRTLAGIEYGTLGFNNVFVHITQSEETTAEGTFQATFFADGARVDVFSARDLLRWVKTHSEFAPQPKHKEKERACIEFNERSSDMVTSESTFDVVTLDFDECLVIGDEHRSHHYYVISPDAMLRLAFGVAAAGRIIGVVMEDNTKIAAKVAEEFPPNESIDDEDVKVEDMGEIEFSDEDDDQADDADEDDDEYYDDDDEDDEEYWDDEDDDDAYF